MYDDACVKSRRRDSKAVNENLKFSVIVPRLQEGVPGNMRIEWCFANIGEHLERWECNGMTHDSIYYAFAKEEDALFFVLMWGSK